MTARVWIPIDLSVASPAALTGPGLDRIEKGLAGAVEKAWLAAQRRLEKDGINHRPRPGIASFEWAGTGWRGIAAADRRRIERRLRGAIERATIAAPPPPRRTAIETPRVTLDRGLAFRTVPRSFFKLIDAGVLARAQPEARYYDVLDRLHDALAFRVTTSGMMFLDEFYPLLERALGARVGLGFKYYYSHVWQARFLRRIINLDPKTLEGPLGGARLTALWAMRGFIYVPPGSHFVVACLLLPEIGVRTATVPEAVDRLTIKLRELDPIVEAAPFLTATGATWNSYRHEWGDDPIVVTLHPFSLKKASHGRSLQAIYAAETTGEASEQLQLGGLVLLTRKAVQDLPSLPLHELTNAITLALPDTAVNREWQAGWHGVYISAWLPLNEYKIDAARYRPEARALIAKLVPLLQQGEARRAFSLIASAFGRSDRAIAQSTAFFGFLLEGLHELPPEGKWLALFYHASESFYPFFELAVRLASGTPYESHPVVLRAIERITARREKAREHVYFAGQGVVIDRRWTLRKGDVLRDGNEMYSVLEKRARIKASSQPKMRTWMLTAATTVIQGAVAAKRDLTKEEFSRGVLEEVQKQITEKDVEQVEVERSLRLIDVIEKDDRGVKRHFVRFNWVERVEGEGGWADVKDEHGNVIVVEREDVKFEELLFFWSYARSSVAVIAFAKGVTYLGTFVVAWGAGVFQLVPHALGFMAFNVLLYLGRAAFFGGDFSIDGLALEGVKGFAMALGFQIFLPIGRFVGVWAAERIGIESIAQRIAGYLVERIVAGAVAGAGANALTLFAVDIVLIAMGAKQGFSGWRDYLHALSEGAKMGILFEFGGDVLRVFGKLESFQALTQAIGKAGWSAREWAKLLDEAQAGLRKWLREVAIDVKTLSLREMFDAFAIEVRGFKLLVFEEARQGLLRRIITRSDIPLSALGQDGLQKMLEATEAKAAEPILLGLARDPRAASRFLEALGALDEHVVAFLANRGKLAALAGTTRLLEMISSRNRLAMSVLDAFALDVAACERFLVELERLPAAVREQGLVILTKGPRPSPALLLRALHHPRLLQQPGVGALLERLEAENLKPYVLDDLLAALDRVGWKFGAEGMTGLAAIARKVSRNDLNQIVDALSAGPRSRAFLEANPTRGADLLGRTFRASPETLEGFLSRMERLPSVEAKSVFKAVEDLGTAADVAKVVSESGKTVEALIELVGERSPPAAALDKYRRRLIDKQLTSLTRQDLTNSLANQERLFRTAKEVVERQQKLADDVMNEIGRKKGEAGSVLKRNSPEALAEAIVKKMNDRGYRTVSEMDDIARGRFNMTDKESVAKVFEAIRKRAQGGRASFRMHEKPGGRDERTLPRLGERTGEFRYPRFHLVVEDVKSGLTHEWQVGTEASSRLYDRGGITIPKVLKDAVEKAGKRVAPDLHDVEYLIFQKAAKKFPAIAESHGIPKFIRDLDTASDKTAFGLQEPGYRAPAGKGGLFTEKTLEEAIASFHKRASEILQKLVDDQGAAWIVDLLR